MSKPNASECSDTGRHTVSPSLSWFSGARRDVLDQCPSERSLYNSLGLAVLLTAMMSGVALAIVVGYVLQIPAIQLWPVAVVWALVIGNVDRQLQILSTSKRLLLAFIPRIAISLVIGILIAEPLMLRIFQPEIDNQLQQNVQQEIQKQTTAISDYYAPKIQLDQKKISAIRHQEQTLKLQILQYEFLASCESTETNCSTTGKLGCGPFCYHYLQLARAAKDQLKSRVPLDTREVKDLEAQIQNLTTTQANQMQHAMAGINGSRGLIAREDALAQIVHSHRGVLYEIWLIRIALVLLDLLPLIIKYLHLAFGIASYERINSARKRQEMSKAHTIDVETRVEASRIDEQGLADEEVNRVIIQIQRDQRITDEETKWRPNSEHSFTTPSRTPNTSQRISTLSLSEYVERIRGHESMPVTIPSWLRTGGWVGSALIACLTITLAAITYYTHRVVAGEWLTFAILAASASLMAFTKGFRIAPTWGLRATFAALLAGLALPIVVLALNL
jgi:hypothetical protein